MKNIFENYQDAIKEDTFGCADTIIKLIENNAIVDYPIKPNAPILIPKHSVQDVLDYASELQFYQLELLEYPPKVLEYDLDQARIVRIITEYIKAETELYRIVPRKYADKLYEYAYSKSHSNGYYSVMASLYDLISIFE